MAKNFWYAVYLDLNTTLHMKTLHFKFLMPVIDSWSSISGATSLSKDVSGFDIVSFQKRHYFQNVSF